MLPYADRIIRIEDGLIHSDERPKEAKQSGKTDTSPPSTQAAASQSGFGYRIRVKQNA